MKKIWKFIKFIGLGIWQLPQIILGAFVLLWLGITRKIVGIKHKEMASVFLMKKQASWGVSLGFFIFVPEDCKEKMVKHEHGHTIQSKYLGPFYLLVVGLPSITMAGLSCILKGEFAANYYKRWPENWADKLGGVVR